VDGCVCGGGGWGGRDALGGAPVSCRELAENKRNGVREGDAWSELPRNGRIRGREGVVVSCHILIVKYEKGGREWAARSCR
jgi:hypothetical protein